MNNHKVAKENTPIILNNTAPRKKIATKKACLKLEKIWDKKTSPL